MESFKIKHFEKENPGLSFPWFRTLKEVETLTIRQHLAGVLSLPTDVTPLVLTQCIADRSVTHLGFNAEADDFNIEVLLHRLEITPASTIYINWYRFDRIDEMRFEDITRYFDYLWYPGPDDIDFFDFTASWVLSIDHDGRVSSVHV